MSEVSWEKRSRKIRSEKDLRLFVRGFLKEKLRGLPPHFRIEVEVLDPPSKRVAVRIPAHSEGNLIRIMQVDHLVEELENYGLQVEVFYLDDLWEREWCPREDSNPQPTA